MLLVDENVAKMLLSSSLSEVEVLPIQESKSTDFLLRILSGHNTGEIGEVSVCRVG